MGKPTGFIEFDRESPNKTAPAERIQHYREFVAPYSEEKLNQQAARCMNCGVPFAIPVVRWATSFRSSMMRCIEKTGKRPMRYFPLPIISPNSPEGFVQPPVNLPVYWASINHL